MRHRILLTLLSCLAAIGTAQAASTTIFDGKSFSGWDGDTNAIWRIADGCLVGGFPDREDQTERVPRDHAELHELHHQGEVQAARRQQGGLHQFRHPDPQPAPAPATAK